jgi:rubrerythrin
MTATVSETTKATGGLTVVTDMTFVAPEQAMPEEELAGFLPGSGLDGPFMADLLSQFLAHEQAGFHLYRVVAGLTQDEQLRARYEEFGAETESHIRILEDLITQVGGRPGYVSPAARLTEAADGKLVEGIVLLAGSADVMTRELAMLESVVLAETKDHADWSLLAALTEQLPEGDVKQAFAAAVREVEPQEDDHVGWATSTWEQMVLAQATGGAAAPVDQSVGDPPLQEVTKAELYAQAQEADVPGRSAMTKEELAQALQEPPAEP